MRNKKLSEEHGFFFEPAEAEICISGGSTSSQANAAQFFEALS